MTTAAPSREATLAFMDKGQRDPAWFARDILGLSLYDKQVEMLESVRDHEQTTVVGGNTLGKDYCTGSAIVPWWQATRYPAKTIIMGPTSRQVEQIVWRHTRQAYHGARFPLGGHMYPRQPMWEGADDHFALGFSTDEPTNITGFHSPNLLVIVTEAHAVSDAHITMIKRLNPKRLVYTGNPFSDSGEFFESHHGKRHLYNAIKISAWDSPNVKAKADVVPGLVSLHDIERYREDWGPESNLFKATVDAEFVGTEDGLIRLSWLQAARGREPVDSAESLIAGVDVAGPGEDETVVCVRQGPNVVAVRSWHLPDARGEVVAFLKSYPQGFASVNVDSIGAGMYFWPHLRDAGFHVRPVNVAEKANNAERYANKRAEYYWGLRQRFELGYICGLTDETAISQLASIKYKHLPLGGRIQIESKDEMRKRGMKSPDRADALLLAFLLPQTVDELTVPQTSTWARAAASAPAGQRIVDQERSALAIAIDDGWTV